MRPIFQHLSVRLQRPGNNRISRFPTNVQATRAEVVRAPRTLRPCLWSIRRLLECGSRRSRETRVESIAYLISLEAPRGGKRKTQMVPRRHEMRNVMMFYDNSCAYSIYASRVLKMIFLADQKRVEQVICRVILEFKPVGTPTEPRSSYWVGRSASLCLAEIYFCSVCMVMASLNLGLPALQGRPTLSREMHARSSFSKEENN